jgi:hypothetical protein
LSHLLKQLKQLKGSGWEPKLLLNEYFLDTLKNLKKDLIELLLDLFKKELNCGVNQTYTNLTQHFIYL